MNEKKTVLIIAMLSAFIAPFEISAINIALPAIKEEFSATVAMLGWVATSYLLTSAIFLIPFGRLADLKGRKRIFILGISFFTIASAISAGINSIEGLIAMRVLQGLGASMIFGTSMAILMSVYPLKERGRALGLTVASTYTGLSAGPFIGGLMTKNIGWRSIFILSAILGFLAVVLAVVKLSGEWSAENREKFDSAGAVLYSIMFLALMYGLSILPAPKGIAFIGFSMLLFAAFIFMELKVKNPVFNVRLFLSNKIFAFSSLAALIHYSATFGITFLLSLYLQFVKGLDPGRAGTVIVAQPVMMALFSPYLGKLSDRVEPRALASSGMALTASGLFAMTFLNNDTSILFVIATLMVIGFGFALFSSPNTNAVMSSVEKQYYGVASGILSTMRITGQMLSMGFATSMLSIFIGTAKITPAVFPGFLQGMKISFSIFAVLCFIGTLLSLTRGKLRN